MSANATINYFKTRRPAASITAAALSILCVLNSNTGLAQSHSQQTLLQQAITQPTTGSTLIYDVMFEKPGTQAFLTLNPTHPSGKRVTVSSPAVESWDPEFAVMLEEMDRNAAKQIWCTDFADVVPDTATVVAQGESTVTYRFNPVPEDESEQMFVKHLTGEITVNRAPPAIASMRLYAQEAFSPVRTGLIKTFEIDLQCQQLPDGRAFVNRLEQRIIGTIANESIDENSSWQLLDYREKIE